MRRAHLPVRLTMLATALLVCGVGQTGTGALLGHWPLDEGSGTTTADVTGNHSPAAISGASWVNDPERGAVLGFDGTDDVVEAGDSVIPQMTTSNDFTWTLWVNSGRNAGDDPQKNAVILGNRYAPSGTESDWTPREFIKFTPGDFEFHRDGAGDDLDYADLTVGEWHHHAVSKDGNVLTYYRDGVESGTHTITAGLDHAQPLYFGGDAHAGNNENEFFDGRLDDIRIFDHALSQAEVRAVIPEPSVLAVLFTSLGLLSLSARRSRRAR